MKHPWWHRFFTETTKSPQMIPPSWVLNQIVIDQNIQHYCRICRKGWEISALDKWRPKGEPK